MKVPRTFSLFAGILLAVILVAPLTGAQGSNGTSFRWAGFFDKLQASAASPRIQKNTLGKRDRGKPFQDIRKDGAVLVGFELTKGDWFGAPLFQSIQPIYLTREGKSLGERRGNRGRDPFRIEARDGYAVGAVNIHDGNFLWSIEVTFMKIDLIRRTLDPKDSYKSEIYGDIEQHPEWMPKKVLGGSGSPIIGIFGFAENELNALGVIQSP